uniref:Uncharacterized protein n=1 Tax=Ascaris lumbricoides TaxID=6252 RepID=A0A0M3IJJ4_ASCLU
MSEKIFFITVFVFPVAECEPIELLLYVITLTNPIVFKKLLYLR